MMKLILLIFSFMFVVQPSLANDSTTSFFQAAGINPAVRFDDGTCGSRFTRYCCHSEIRYSCRFLMNQFKAGYCRPNKKDKRNNSWRRCKNLPKLSVTERGTREATTPARGTYPLTRPTGATSYAAELTACAGYGRRQAYAYARRKGHKSGAGYCAVGVRTALACMDRKLGNKANNMKFHCGGNAGAYVGCLTRRKGFKRDMNACNTPGVVRVYYGHRQGKSRRRDLDNSGDVNGHIEFLGTDGMWHAGTASALPIDQRMGKGRRILKGCYIYKGGK